MMLRFYVVSERFMRGNPCIEICWHIELTRELVGTEKQSLVQLLRDFSKSDELRETPFIAAPGLEIGPRIDVVSPRSRRWVTLCHTVGLRQVLRIEQSLRYVRAPVNWAATLDHETEMVYTVPPESFVLS